MLVYRACDRCELFKILDNRSFDNVGKCINNFSFSKDKLYLSFFDNFEDAFKLKNNDYNYICLYNIPDKLLINSVCHRNINLYGKEYIVPINLLDIKYFLCYEEIKSEMLMNKREFRKKKIK